MEKKDTSDSLVHELNTSSDMKGTSKSSLILFVVLLLLGIGTGYVFASIKNTGSGIVTPGGTNNTATSSSSCTKGLVIGSKDTKTFKDNAEGMLKPGGIDGEGAFHLERPGGESQNVYLTSSVLDLSICEGKKVKVWGQTNDAQTAGWLMDVGRLQVLE